MRYSPTAASRRCENGCCAGSPRGRNDERSRGAASVGCAATIRPAEQRHAMTPLRPARVDFSDASAPRATDFDDVYHPRGGALEQARHVFLAGNGLPRRWAGRTHFVVLETGFGLGNNFIATWAAWRDD